jgi:hypothetical protein
VPALASFLRNELHRRDWSPEEFARRCVPPISTSLAYQIIRDNKDNVRQSTFDAIAAAFGMTPSAFHAAIYGGREVTGLPPDELEMLHHYRRVEPEKRSTALSLLHALGVEPTQRRAIGRQDAAAKRQKAADRKQAGRRPSGPDDDTGSPLINRSHRVSRGSPPWRPLAATGSGTS